MNMDYDRHNRKSERIWHDFRSGKPSRVPVTIYADSRNWLAENDLNLEKITLGHYLADPRIMLETQVKTQEWKRLNILSDDGMGYPEFWSVIVDCQNYLEIAWLGGSVIYGAEPHCRPFLTDEKKYEFISGKTADPWTGINDYVRQTYEYFTSQKGRFNYKGITVGNISMPYNMTGTDGPFTIACGIRGAESLILDMLDEPDYARKLLEYITECIIQRIKSVRSYLGEPLKADSFGFADDSIVLLSNAMFKEFVLPCHRKIFQELAKADSYRSMHLCGDAQRFFPVLQKELNVKQFDTGFPIDFAKLYKELSSDTIILGGPPAGLLLNGTPGQIDTYIKEILSSGVMEFSKAFILREANALAPGTPLENVNQIYNSTEKYGYYQEARHE